MTTRSGRMERAVRNQLREANLLGTGIKTPALGQQAILLASVIDTPTPITEPCTVCGEDTTIEFPAPSTRELAALARELRMTMGAVLKEGTGGDDGDSDDSGGPD